LSDRFLDETGSYHGLGYLVELVSVDAAGSHLLDELQSLHLPCLGVGEYEDVG